MCITTIIEEIAQVPWEIVPKDPKLEEAPPEDILYEIDLVKDFFNNPNPNKGETINTLIRAALQDSLSIDALSFVKGFSENSYMRHPAGGWELKPQGQRDLVELWGRDGGSFLKEVDVDGVEYRYWQYSYLHPAVAPIEFAVDEIAYGMRYPRTYSAYGWSELQSAETILNLLINSSFANATMFQDYSVPSGVISFTGSPEDEDRLREYFRQEVKGRFHKVAVLNKEAKFVPLAYTNRDLEFISGQQWFSKLFWSLYKLTPTELGFSDDIRDTGKAMNAQSVIQKRKSIMPILGLLEQIFNNQIVNEFSPRIKFRYNASDKQEEMAEDELYVELGKMGYVLPNEWRKKRKWGGPTEYGDMPIDIAKALIAAGAKAQASPQPQGVAGPLQPQNPQEMEQIPHKPMTAEEKSIYETLKAWGANPNMSWDFADKSDRATPIFVRTPDGGFKQVAEPSPRRLPPKELQAIKKAYRPQDDIAWKGFAQSPKFAQDRVWMQLKEQFPNIPDSELVAKVNEVIAKQYAKPTARRIGPYAGQGRGPPYPMGALGNRPDEPIRAGTELLPGENPEEIQRAREASSPLEASGLGTEPVESPEEQGDVTRRDPRKPPIGPPAKSGTNSKRWERDETHGKGNVGTMHSPKLDQDLMGPRRQPTDPVHDVNTESQFMPTADNCADGNNPRKPTPQIPRGPKYPKDVPPVGSDSGIGALGGGSPTGSEKKKPQKVLGMMGMSNPQGPTTTGATGPQHQETLGYLERGMKDPRVRAMFEKERKEHPKFSDADIMTIVQDHLREKSLVEDTEAPVTYSFDNTGREQFAQTMSKIGYVESPEFQQSDTSKGYFCGSCEYMKQSGASPTGFACLKFKFPDRPHGCCNGWESKNETETKDLVHGHAPFSNVVQVERGLRNKLVSLVKSFKDGSISKDQALNQAREAIDAKAAQLMEYARKRTARVTGKGIIELAPEQSQRIEGFRTQTLIDFQRVLDDSQ